MPLEPPVTTALRPSNSCTSQFPPCLMKAWEIRLEVPVRAAEQLEFFLIDRDPCRDRIDRLADAYQIGRRLPDGGEFTLRAAQHGKHTARRTVAGRRNFDRHSRDGRFDLHPDPAVDRAAHARAASAAARAAGSGPVMLSMSAKAAPSSAALMISACVVAQVIPASTPFAFVSQIGARSPARYGRKISGLGSGHCARICASSFL